MNAGPEEQTILSSSSSSSSSYVSESDEDELQGMALTPPPWNATKMLSKQLSLRCETSRDVAWERRRRQILSQERKKDEGMKETEDLTVTLTDEDLHELKGCIELGFGFKEEEGQRLCNTLPALDLYFAVNRQVSVSPVSTPHTSSASSLQLDGSLGGRSSSFGSTKSEESWKICSPGLNTTTTSINYVHYSSSSTTVKLLIIFLKNSNP